MVKIDGASLPSQVFSGKFDAWVVPGAFSFPAFGARHFMDGAAAMRASLSRTRTILFCVSNSFFSDS
jgi:hypothetical protein